MKRILFDAILFLSILLLPWWITAVLAFLGIFIFKNYYEFLIVSAIMFALYRIPADRWIASKALYPLTVGIIYIGIQALRKNIILYNNEI